jgi:hypothetical protein
MDTEKLDPQSHQIALAMTSLAVAFTKTLRDLLPPDTEPDALEILQRQLKVVNTKLRQTADAKIATDILRFVQERLRDPNVIDQPAE